MSVERRVADWLLPKLIKLYELAADRDGDESAAVIAAVLRGVESLATLDAKRELAALAGHAERLHLQALHVAPDE